ncbi:unnamed protein product [Lota lota]
MALLEGYRLVYEPCSRGRVLSGLCDCLHSPSPPGVSKTVTVAVRGGGPVAQGQGPGRTGSPTPSLSGQRDPFMYRLPKGLREPTSPRPRRSEERSLRLKPRVWSETAEVEIVDALRAPDTESLHLSGTARLTIHCPATQPRALSRYVIEARPQ